MSETAVRRAVRVLFRKIDTTDPRRRRLQGLLQGVVTGGGNKLLSMAISFLSVPLTIRYLGAERYGAWVTIGSLMAWVSLTDFGLGNGIQNAVTAAAGQDRPDLVRMHLSNGAILLSGIAAMAGVIAFVLWPWIDWSAVLGVTSTEAKTEVGRAAGLALAFFFIGFPLSMTGKLYLAYQDGRLGSYWGMAGNVLSFAALIAVTQSNGGLVSLVLALSGTSTLVNVVAAIWMFGWYRPHVRPGLAHLDVSHMRELINVGGKFFLLQILGLLIFQTDNIVIAHYLGARRVPEYSLTYTLFTYTGLPQNLLFQYLWNAYTEAIARGDIQWVRRTLRLNLLVGLGFTLAACVALAFLARPFISAWAGSDVIPSYGLIGWMAAWGMINAYCNPMACLLAASAHLRNQIVYSAVGTALNVVLTLYLVQIWGAAGVLAATVISYLLAICGPIAFDTRLLLRKLDRQAVEQQA